MSSIRFFVFIVVTLVVYIYILRWTLRARAVTPTAGVTASLAFIVVIVGMYFARFGANAGMPWPIYYGVPAATTLLLPPLVLRMRFSEFARYVVLAFASSPVIHAVFSLFVGWHEYMPFWNIPSLWGAGA
ncbi:hypothetical protein Deima_0388 [Deinococcus maricopensis DSM 21211]|uniref:Uncharacterized protein n=2 Tax=Deinococcus TaxID=1298 RepID=E8U3A3_DEIML|nr:hypothetical protein Deima_0388 [Deinococcus maricopensis DSM 21211]